MINPLLSVVIPTKNRYEYLLNLLDSLLAERSDKFEIIIQDNSDDNTEIVAYLSQVNDSRVRYNYSQGWLSVIDNCDLAISQATGDFVCMLGDDDGIVLESSLKLLEYMQRNNHHAANVNIISYMWPDTSHAVWKDALSGTVSSQSFTYSISNLDAKMELAKIMKQGAAYGLGQIPRVYHAFVSKAMLDKLMAETGTYFPGPSPDMANGVGLTKYIDNFLYASIPTIISGHSKKSTGGQGQKRKHHGKIENIGHLPKDTGSKWSRKIPYFWSGPTIYAESARRALEATNRIDELNYDYLRAVCLVYERNYSEFIWKTINTKNQGSTPLSILILFVNFVTIIIRRGLNYIKNKKKTLRKNKDLVFKANSIKEVIDCCKNELNKVKLEKLLNQ